MTTYRNITAISAAAALVTLGSFALAQDDLDDLLSDLETSETKAAEAAKPEAAAPAAEEAKAEPEAAAEAAAPAEEKAEAEEVVEATASAAEEAKAEPAAVAEAAAPAAEETTAEPEAVAEAAAPAAEEAKAEPAAVAEAAAPAAKEDDSDLTLEVAAAPVATAGETAAAVTAEPVPEEAEDEVLGLTDEDRELLANIQQTEEIRRNSYDKVAKDAIREARAAMMAQDYATAARLYGNAAKLLNDSPTLKPFAKECAQGEAEAFYRFGLKEWEVGRRESAMKQMKKAIEKRNPLAKAQLDAWMHADDPDANATDYADITHRQNEKDYKEQRERDTRHLKRARQLLSVRDLDKALEECEMVLRKEPYNEEALRLRRQIIKKQSNILADEFETTRDGMIAEVDKKWRPVYAPNVREVDEVASSTIKRHVDVDPERALEQTIVKRMKEMRLPTIQFKPPATIIDAVEFFRTASKDFDDPTTPIEKRGFNFVLKSSETLRTQAAVANEDSNDFGAAAEEPANGGQAGVPVIPMITASDITFYEALKLVCDSVDYKFKVQGPIVMVMPKNMTVDEMVTRSYPVMAAFFEKMDNVSSDMKELRSGGFGSSSNRQRDKDEGEDKERDWKEVFSQLGVQWPEGSSIFYMKATGKLRVKNTYENLAELEKALIELNAEQKLVEIEARFVEVQQEDLNSLGFEWILNSDYTIGGGWLANKLGLGKAGFTEGWTKSSKTTVQDVTIPGGSGGAAGPTTYSQATVNETTMSGTGKQIWSQYDMNGRRIQKGIAGINSFGGADATYAPNNRYLSTVGNQIATQMKAEGNAINDQFMRVNAFLGSADLSMILHMLSQRTDTDLLSAPKVLTRPGEEAVIKVVTEYIYPTDYDVQLQSSSSSSGSSGSGSSSAILAVVEPQSFTMREVGVILDVTPTLTDDGNLIDLKLNTQVVDEPEWKNYGMKIPFTGNSNMNSANPLDYIAGIVGAATQLGVEMTDSLKGMLFNDIVTTSLDSMRNASSTITYYDAPMEQPFFHVRSIDSSVSIYPGATIVMGGLITETRKAMDDKIPFLGDLPFVGRLFRSHSELTSKKNLLIFVTTRLVDVRGREVVLNNNEVKDATVTAAPEVGE